MKRPKYIDLTEEEKQALLERVQAEMSPQDHELITGIVETLAMVSQSLEEKNISIGRLRRMVFGATTESSKNLFPEDKPSSDRSKRGKKKKKRKGHGRNGADAYTGAEEVFIPHKKLGPGDGCPNPNCSGKLYDNVEPGTVVRLHGNPLMTAMVNRPQKLRCNVCGEIFTAELPQEAGEKKYDEQAATNIAILKYGSGFPFYRMRVFQENFGIPLPESTQWDIVKQMAGQLEPVHEEMIRQAAQGKVLHNDDTPMKILSLMKSALKEDRKKEKKSRSGVFTSGVLSVKCEIEICLFFTGTQHAGEALNTVLEHRDESRPRPLQMCDALDRNKPKKSKTVLGNCNSHGRRKFADIVSSFPEQARHVIDLLAKVYHHDETAEKNKMSDRERLAYHQEHSKPIMDDLHEWLNKQLDEKLVEPNGAAGKAIQYMINHWKKLTLFLKRPGAPLDNNALERSLKVPILHRKNSYFYKTENGAHVGDIFMSIIHTCRLNHINASDFLNTVQRHADQIARDPPAWMPWNYTKAVHALEKA